MNEDKLILAQAEDRIEQCRAYDMLTHTGFLDARQQSLARRAFGVRQGEVQLLYYGGYEDADRVILTALPYYMSDMTGEESLYPNAAKTDSGSAGSEDASLSVAAAAPVRELLTVIRATAPKGSHASRSGRALSHSDYLGALMGLGIKRTVVGDILVREDGADIIVLTEIADFIMQTFASAGRSHLSLERLPIEALIIPAHETHEIHDTVASLRLDALLAAAFRMPRGKAADAIRQGLVFVDHLEATKSDMPVEEGAELVIRHKGKAILSEVGGRSRKDRINVTFTRYGK
jgi:RNA-binding protein YlmH